MRKRDSLQAVGACALLSSTVFALWQVPMKTYITTPIYYVNGAPHIGHAHTSVMADILKRNRIAIGYEGKLTTGCDEHGQKNQEAAAESGLSVEEYLDGRSAEFRNVFDRLSVEYDYFVRTSCPEHKQRVAEIEQRMYDADLIVKKEYSGTYCTGCEQFKKPSDLNDDGRCPDHPTLVPEEITEENYFLKIEPFRDALLKHIADHPDFVQPEIYKTELLKMLSEPLEDLCISRPKRRVSLGVTMPFDDDYVTYVWFDALINYITNINWPEDEYKAWWAECEHLIGKDILKTHGVYWPIMLMAIDMAPPKRLSVHGHWVGAGGLKMSKTMGNVVDPIEVMDNLGSDALRYYLARNARADADSQISVELITQAYNSELGNKLGNLLSRAGKFSKSRFDGKVPERGSGAVDDADEQLRKQVMEACAPFAKKLDLAEIPYATQGLITVCDHMNNYFADQAPWDLIKNEDTKERCAAVIYVTLDCLRLVFEAFSQVLPTTSAQALGLLNCTVPTGGDEAWVPGLDKLQAGGDLAEISTLYPRAA